jgi:hypothetical protein
VNSENDTFDEVLSLADAFLMDRATIYGATDEYGYRVVENKLTVHDMHANMLHLLGIDHKRLTYSHSGRDMRLTDVHGEVIPEIVGT